MVGEGLELEYLAAGHERGVDCEEGVFGSCSQQCHYSVLYVVEEDVLLAAVEAVEFIDEEDGFLSIVRKAASGLGENSPYVLHSDDGRVDLLEGGLGCGGYYSGEGGLAAAGRSIEDGTGEPV